jgi:hypothetical protein
MVCTFLASRQHILQIYAAQTKGYHERYPYMAGNYVGRSTTMCRRTSTAVMLMGAGNLMMDPSSFKNDDSISILEPLKFTIFYIFK